MKQRNGSVLLSVILLIVGALTIGGGVMSVAAILGRAPVCPDGPGQARTESVIGQAITKGSVNITNTEATAIAQNYIGQPVQDVRVCFTKGKGHVSGSILLGPIKPTFYVSSGVDLSGQTPRLTGLAISLGSLPNVPVLSIFAEGVVNRFLLSAVSRFHLKQSYTATFQNGSMTIGK